MKYEFFSLNNLYFPHINTLITPLSLKFDYMLHRINQNYKHNSLELCN